MQRYKPRNEGQGLRCPCMVRGTEPLVPPRMSLQTMANTRARGWRVSNTQDAQNHYEGRACRQASSMDSIGRCGLASMASMSSMGRNNVRGTCTGAASRGFRGDNTGLQARGLRHRARKEVE